MENPVSIQEGILGALQQLRQPNKKSGGYSHLVYLYFAVMAIKHRDLVAPMISHMHMVMWLQATHGGMSWLQCNWWSLRERNAEGCNHSSRKT